MLWIKAFHIIFVVTWFAGLFYLPRLFVYHAMTDDASGQERFKVMEHKLYYAITTPSAFLATGFGLWLLIAYWWNPFLNVTGVGWLYLKLVLVILLFSYHWYCGQFLKDFKHNCNHHSHVFYRWFNELPVIILIAVIILVEVQPF